MNLQFIKSDFPGAERGQHVYFRFKDIDGCIELKFDAPQDEPITGWNIKPHMKPCRVSITVYYACMVDIIILYFLSLNSCIVVMLTDLVKLIILFLHLV